MKHQYDCIDALRAAGINYEDACALRRISMTLHRWHELECGDGNNYGAWCITRGTQTKTGFASYIFEHDDDGKPYLEHHHYLHGKGKDYVTYSALADRERGALKRLAAIMARYPDYLSYVQGDPRGCALYILHSIAIAGADAFSTDPAKRAEWLSCNYTRGMAVHK